MDFQLTPEEAQPAAIAAKAYYIAQGMTVAVEISAWVDAPYRTSLVASKSGLKVLVEAQGSLDYHRPLRELALQMAAENHYAELYIVTNSEAPTTAKTFAELKKDGAGLLIINDSGEIQVIIKARNAALIVRPEPTLIYGQCEREVLAAVKKFNEEDRKDGLRDMCELVERENKRLALITVRKGLLNKTELQINTMSWDNIINVLESAQSYHSPHLPVISSTLKDDLLSFKGARNLVDHPAQNRRAEIIRERQFPERMMMGTRLISELMTIKRRVR